MTVKWNSSRRGGRIVTENEVNTASKKKILMIHNFYQVGGGEHTVFKNEVILLRNHGHEVFEYTRSNDELKTSKIKMLLLPFSSIFSLKTYRDVKKIIKARKIDIVHCHNTFPLISPSVYYAAKKCGIPIVQTIHNFRFLCPNGVFFRNNKTCEDCLRKGLGYSLKYNCYRESKIQTLVVVNMLCVHRILKTFQIPRYIFLTNFNRKKFKRLLGERLDCEFIKPNFEYVEFTNEIEERDGSFVYIGRLDKNKGIDFLVENWEHDRNLFVFGNGALENYVRKACERNAGLHYMGFQPQEKILKYLGKATAMLFPTDLYEGFPMTLIESFAMGTPVICSNIGNAADIVKKEKAGVVYDRRNKEALYKAIREVEMDFEMYSYNSKKAYKKKYAPEANYKQIQSIYEAISK